MLSIDDPERPPTAYQAIGPFRGPETWLEVVDTNSAGIVLAFGEMRAFGICAGSPTLEDAHGDVLYLGDCTAENTDLIAGCVTEYADADWSANSSGMDDEQLVFRELRFSKADLAAFATELRALANGSGEFAWLTSTPPLIDPTITFYDLERIGGEVAVNASWSSAREGELREIPGEYRLVCRTIANRVAFTISVVNEYGAASSSGEDSIRLLDFLARQIDEVLAPLPPSRDTAPSVRPRIVHPYGSPNCEVVDPSVARVFPSLDDKDPLFESADD